MAAAAAAACGRKSDAGRTVQKVADVEVEAGVCLLFICCC